MTKDQWSIIVKMIGELWTHWEATETRAQVWRMSLEKFEFPIVQAAIYKHYRETSDKFDPSLKKILIRCRRDTDLADYQSRVDMKALPVDKPTTPCAPLLTDPSQMDPRDRPECQRIPEPTKEQVEEAARVKAAFRRLK